MAKVALRAGSLHTWHHLCCGPSSASAREYSGSTAGPAFLWGRWNERCLLPQLAGVRNSEDGTDAEISPQNGSVPAIKRNSFIEIQLMYHKIHPFFVFLQSLCSHYQCVISEYFHHPLGVPPISPFPISWQPQICFLFVDLSLEHFNQVESCSTHLLVTGFISLNMAFSVFIHVVACVITYCVLPPNNIPLCGYATFYLFTSCWTFGLFLLCCCWGKAAMNRCMQISFLYYTNNLFKENYLKINWGLCVCFGHS